MKNINCNGLKNTDVQKRVQQWNGNPFPNTFFKVSVF